MQGLYCLWSKGGDQDLIRPPNGMIILRQLRASSDGVELGGPVAYLAVSSSDVNRQSISLYVCRVFIEKKVI